MLIVSCLVVRSLESVLARKQFESVLTRKQFDLGLCCDGVVTTQELVSSSVSVVWCGGNSWMGTSDDHSSQLRKRCNRNVVKWTAFYVPVSSAVPLVFHE